MTENAPGESFRLFDPHSSALIRNEHHHIVLISSAGICEGNMHSDNHRASQVAPLYYPCLASSAGICEGNMHSYGQSSFREPRNEIGDNRGEYR